MTLFNWFTIVCMWSILVLLAYSEAAPKPSLPKDEGKVYLYFLWTTSIYFRYSTVLKFCAGHYSAMLQFEIHIPYVNIFIHIYYVTFYYTL